MGIYDAMKLCKADVSTVCLGLAASMGAFLLAAGTKGKRYCMPNGRVMIHQPLGTAGGKVIVHFCVLLFSMLIRWCTYFSAEISLINLAGVSGSLFEVDYLLQFWICSID